MKEKIVIIGAGVAGLTAGVYGCLAGYDVEIYEKNAVPGGECTGWDRQGYHIDNCIHWMIGTRDNSDLHDIWRETHAVESQENVHDFPYMYVSELNNERITLWKDIERTRREMLALSPEDTEEINSLIESCLLAKDLMIPAKVPSEQWSIAYAMGMLTKAKGLFSLMKKYKGMDTQDLMNRFKHPLLQCVLRDFCTKESGATSFPMAYGNFVGGDGGIPKGGSRAMALRMAERFRSLGGKLFLSKPAEKLNVENGRVKSLRLADGTEVTGDWYIPACDASFTFEKLLDPSYEDAVFQSFFTKPEVYPVYGMFQVAIAVHSEKDLLEGDVNIDVRDLCTQSWMGERMVVKNYAYEPDFAPKGKQIMEILYGGSDSCYTYFKTLYAKDRAAYDAAKQELAESLLKRVEERWPLYAGKLEILDVWTPVTYERYCNAYKGYNQACIISKYADKNSTPSPFLKGAKNVVLAGQWLSPPGGLPGAAITGRFAIARVKRRFRFNRINVERIALILLGTLGFLLPKLLA